MLYKAVLRSKKEKLYYFKGYKKNENSFRLDVWLDTNTIFITLYDRERILTI